MAEDNKKTQDTSKEEENKDSGAINLRYLELIKTEGAKKIIEELNESAIEAREEAKAKKEEPAFVTKFGTKEPYEEIVDYLEMLKEDVIYEGYTVEVLEDTEYLNVTTGSRFHVKITYINETYVEFDLNKYKESLLDYDFDAVDYIEGLLVKIVGDSSDETFKSAEKIVKYLAYAIYYPEAYVRTYTKIGWDYLYNQLVFKYNKIYPSHCIEGRCIDEIVDSLAPEKYDEKNRTDWILHTIKLLNYSVTDSLLFGASVSGVIRQLLPYTKETNININIVGERASGKSTICHYLLSTFGNPAKLEGSFTDTTNKMEEIRSSRPVLPYILDERMLRIEEESEKNKRKSIIMDIFREYEGKVKERVGKQYKTLSGARTCGPIISSSVKSMMDEIYDYTDIGQFRRFIELSVTPKDLFVDKEMAEETETIASTSYAYGIEILINYILRMIERDEEVIIKRFKEVNNKITLAMKETDNKAIESSSKRFALIVLSYQIFRESLLFMLNEENQIDYQEDLEVKTDKIIEVLINNITEKLEKVKVYEKPENHLLEYIEKHRDAFCSNKDGWRDENELPESYIGKLYGDRIITIELRQSYDLARVLFAKNIPEPAQIKKYIKLFEDKKTRGKNPEATTLHSKFKPLTKEQYAYFKKEYPWITVEEDKRGYFNNNKIQRTTVITIDLEDYNKLKATEEKEGV